MCVCLFLQKVNRLNFIFYQVLISSPHLLFITYWNKILKSNEIYFPSLSYYSKPFTYIKFSGHSYDLVFFVVPFYTKELKYRETSYTAYWLPHWLSAYIQENEHSLKTTPTQIHGWLNTLSRTTQWGKLFLVFLPLCFILN